MILIVLALAAVLVGIRLARWWALAIPLTVGVLLGTAISTAGKQLTDTPIAFCVIVSTIAIGSGIAIGRHRTTAAL